MSWKMEKLFVSQSKPSSESRDSRYESCDLGIKLDTMHLIVYLPDKIFELDESVRLHNHTRHDTKMTQHLRAPI